MPLNASGAQQVFVSGAAETICPPDPIQVSSVLSSTTHNPGGPGGTAFTGVKILFLILAALVLLGGGLALTTMGKKRRPSRHSA
jgi:hypothetical protein